MPRALPWVLDWARASESLEGKGVGVEVGVGMAVAVDVGVGGEVGIGVGGGGGVGVSVGGGGGVGVEVGGGGGGGVWVAVGSGSGSLTASHETHPLSGPFRPGSSWRARTRTPQALEESKAGMWVEGESPCSTTTLPSGSPDLPCRQETT